MTTLISRTMKSGAKFEVEGMYVSGKRSVVALLDGVEIARDAQVAWGLSPASVGDKTHAAGRPGGKVVGMTSAEARKVGEYLYAEEIAQAAKERRHDALYNEGHMDGFNPHAR